MWEHNKKVSSSISEPVPGTKSARTLISDLLASQIVRNKFLFLMSHPVYGILL